MTFMKVVFIVIFFIFNAHCFAQEKFTEKLIDSLRYADSTYKFCNSTYWRIIKSGKSAIPYLIAKLPDTTKTRVAGYCKKEILTIGEVAFLALEEIIPLPLFEITKREFDIVEEGGCFTGFARYLSENQQTFYHQVKNWYKKIKNKIVWKKYDDSDLEECQKLNGITGYYSTR